MDIKEQFEKASVDVQSLSERPSNDILLKLYALFKQATEGDVAGQRPDGFDFKGAAKYDAWADIKGMPGEDAMKEYVKLVRSLFEK